MGRTIKEVLGALGGAAMLLVTAVGCGSDSPETGGDASTASTSTVRSSTTSTAPEELADLELIWRFRDDEVFVGANAQVILARRSEQGSGALVESLVAYEPDGEVLNVLPMSDLGLEGRESIASAAYVLIGTTLVAQRDGVPPTDNESGFVTPTAAPGPELVGIDLIAGEIDWTLPDPGIEQLAGPFGGRAALWGDYDYMAGVPTLLLDGEGNAQTPAEVCADAGFSLSEATASEGAFSELALGGETVGALRCDRDGSSDQVIVAFDSGGTLWAEPIQAPPDAGTGENFISLGPAVLNGDQGVFLVSSGYETYRIIDQQTGEVLAETTNAGVAPFYVNHSGEFYGYAGDTRVDISTGTTSQLMLPVTSDMPGAGTQESSPGRVVGITPGLEPTLIVAQAIVGDGTGDHAFVRMDPLTGEVLGRPSLPMFVGYPAHTGQYKSVFIAATESHKRANSVVVLHSEPESDQ